MGQILPIQQLVDEAVASQNEDRDHTYWHASSLGGCLSGQYFEHIGLEPDFHHDQRTLRLFQVGRIFEDWALDCFIKSLPDNYSITRDSEPQNNLIDEANLVNAHPDAILWAKDKPVAAYEAKSINSNAFWYMDSRKEQGYEHHRLQLWVALKKLNVPQGLLFYVSKDDLTMAEYPVFLSDEKLSADYQRITSELNKALASKKPPKPELDHTTWQYQRCKYHLKCLESVGEAIYKEKQYKNRRTSYVEKPIDAIRRELTNGG